MSTRRLAAVALVVVLLLAGVASYYASSHPDGLEAVAQRTGFADTARDSATSESPLADYQTRGVEDERLSGGLSGVLGVLVVLALSGGLFWAVRRRGTAEPAEPGRTGGEPAGDDRASDDAARPARHDAER